MLTVYCLPSQFCRKVIATSLAISLIFAGPFADAKRAASCAQTNTKKKGSIIATSYYLPSFKSFNSKAKKAMNMQGSVVAEGKIYKYTGKNKKPKTTSVSACPSVFGMPTTTGAAGRCLIPFVSVAADKKKFPMGTIIEVPEMKGKRFKLPNGKSFTHPGFLIVQDTGGAIKGTGRFDFYTGTANPFKSDFYNKFRLTDKNKCSYAYNGIPSETGSGDANPRWEAAQAAIQDSLMGVNETKMAQYMGKNYGTTKARVAAVK